MTKQTTIVVIGALRVKTVAPNVSSIWHMKQTQEKGPITHMEKQQMHSQSDQGLHWSLTELLDTIEC